MKSSYLDRVGKYGVLFLLLCGAVHRAIPNNATRSPGQEFIAELRKFCNDFTDTTSFSKFCVKLATFLKEYEAAIKNEFPTLDIPALIAALKAIQDKTSSLVIGFKLYPFFKQLPQDLQDRTVWQNALQKRLAF